MIFNEETVVQALSHFFTDSMVEAIMEDMKVIQDTEDYLKEVAKYEALRTDA